MTDIYISCKFQSKNRVTNAQTWADDNPIFKVDADAEAIVNHLLYMTENGEDDWVQTAAAVGAYFHKVNTHALDPIANNYFFLEITDTGEKIRVRLSKIDEQQFTARQNFLREVIGPEKVSDAVSKAINSLSNSSLH